MRILAVGCHPDDLEIGCYGTLAKYVQLGHEVSVCHVANGNLGHVEIMQDELRKIRFEEAEEAAHVIGAKHYSVDANDLYVTADDDELVRRLAAVVRKAQPDMIITHYENALGAYVILTAFMPMLMSAGGNAGSQSSVSIIRGLALDEIDYSDTFRILLKEFTVGAICGITLAVANFAKLMLFDKLTFEVSIVICGALLLTIIAAKLIGCSLPILAKRLGFDPAVMANPFITTLVDAISLIVYFQIATMVLHI